MAQLATVELAFIHARVRGNVSTSSEAAVGDRARDIMSGATSLGGSSRCNEGETTLTTITASQKPRISRRENRDSRMTRHVFHIRGRLAQFDISVAQDMLSGRSGKLGL
jgi:hypothetical protein